MRTYLAYMNGLQWNTRIALINKIVRGYESAKCLFHIRVMDNFSWINHANNFDVESRVRINTARANALSRFGSDGFALFDCENLHERH